MDIQIDPLGWKTRILVHEVTVTKIKPKISLFWCPKLVRSFDEQHPFHWFSAPDSTAVRSWKVTQWMTLESPYPNGYHKDSWPKPAMKMQIRTFLLRQYRGLRRHLQKRVIILLSTVPRTEGALKNDQKCLKIQKVAWPCGSWVRDLGFHVSAHVKS